MLEHFDVRVNGVRLHVAAAGPADGPPVILLHGFPEFWYGWRRQIPLLAAAGFRVWAPDQRGYNLSDKPAGVNAYRFDAIADDVVGLIEATGKAKAFVVGHDWGGVAAWGAAGRQPDRFERMVIINVPHPAVMIRHIQSSFAQLAKSWYVFAFQIPWLPEMMAGAKNWADMWQALKDSARPGAFPDEEFAEYRRAWTRPGAFTAMIHWYRAAGQRRPPTPTRPRIKVPTLILWGANDRFVGRELAEPSRALCDDGRLEFFEDATHWLPLEDPNRVAERIIGFFRGSAR